jgi:hypothetical protein
MDITDMNMVVRSTPSHHPFIDVFFHEINHPAIGVPPILGNPHLVISKLGWSNDCFPSEEQDFSWKMNVFFDGS